MSTLFTTTRACRKGRLSARRSDDDAEQQIRAALEAAVHGAADFQRETVVAQISRRREIAIPAREAENHLAVAGRARQGKLPEDAGKPPNAAAAAFSGLNRHIRGARALAPA